MKTAYCLDCDRSIKLGDRVSISDVVECLHCEAEFQIMNLDPPDLEWLYEEDDDWYEEEEEEEEEDGAESWSWMLAKRRRVDAFDQARDPNRNREGRRKNEYEYDY